MTTTSPPLTLSEVAYRELLSCVISRLNQHSQTLKDNDYNRNPTFVAAITGTVEKLAELDAQKDPVAVREGLQTFAIIWRDTDPTWQNFALDLLLDVRGWLNHVDRTLQLVDQLCEDSFAPSVSDDE